MIKYARKEDKKVIGDVKFEAYVELYDMLGTKDGEKDVYKLAKLRERKTKDFNHINCIKNENSRVNARGKNHTGNTILEESGNIREIRESIFFCKIRASDLCTEEDKIRKSIRT